MEDAVRSASTAVEAPVRLVLRVRLAADGATAAASDHSSPMACEGSASPRSILLQKKQKLIHSQARCAK